MTIADLIDALERIAPPDHAETWDTVGLLVGRREAPLSGPVLLTIDFTGAVLAEARSLGAGAVVAYHPPIFKPLSRLTSDDPGERAILGAVEVGVAIYSPHTAIDAAPGGVTDWLCDMLGENKGDGKALGDRRALVPSQAHGTRSMHKFVTFVPADAVEGVRNALASIGAGIIGEYEQCSFMLEGRGTFFGREGTNPAAGESGQLESVEEVRLEMVCPGRSLPLAVEMLRQFHPYEEPPCDIYPLTPRPLREIGAGRRITLDRPATPQELAARLKANLGLEAVKLAAATDQPVSRIGLCPGSGGDLLDPAIENGCEVFITGEMSHHRVLAGVRRGCSVILPGHTNTERGYLPRLAERLGGLLPDGTFAISEVDRSPFKTL